MRILTIGALAIMSAVAPAALADTTFTATQDAAGTVAVEVAPAEAGTWTQIVDATGIVPYGTSFSPIYDLGAGVQVDALRARLFQYRGEICGATIYSVDVALDPAQRVLTRYFPNANGEIALPNSRLYKVGFVLSQSLLRGGRCVIRLDGLMGDDSRNPDVPNGFELAGAVSYRGGFRHQEVISLGTPAKISAFQVRIPNFCGDVEVLEGGTITEGQYDAASLVDTANMIFSVNGGAGSRVSAVALSFNGPTTLSCDIPVYIKKVP